MSITMSRPNTSSLSTSRFCLLVCECPLPRSQRISRCLLLLPALLCVTVFRSISPLLASLTRSPLLRRVLWLLRLKYRVAFERSENHSIMRASHPFASSILRFEHFGIAQSRPSCRVRNLHTPRYNALDVDTLPNALLQRRNKTYKKHNARNCHQVLDLLQHRTLGNLNLSKA